MVDSNDKDIVEIFAPSPHRWYYSFRTSAEPGSWKHTGVPRKIHLSVGLTRERILIRHQFHA